jgi:hypothetical protein
VRYLLLIAIFFLSIAQSIGQYTEIGFHGGMSYYIGDINPYKHFSHYPHAGGGFFIRTNTSDRVAFKFNFLYTNVEAHDSDSKDAWQRNRNLNFKSEIIEIGTMLEINFLSYEAGDKKRPFTPYVFGGLAYYRMNPLGQYNGRWVELQPLGTEGQYIGSSTKSYRRGQIALPLGMGFKLNLGKRVAVGLEYGIRKLFTDYLDDVSTVYANADDLEEFSGPAAVEMSDRSLIPVGPDNTNEGTNRGNSSTNDYYAYTNLNISIRLGPTRIKCPKAGP